MRLQTYEKVDSIEKAYALMQDGNNQLFGGGGWLKLTKVSKNIGIDLEKLNLNKISQDASGLHIGAMSTLREIETSGQVAKVCSGVLKKSTSMIMGITVRNIVTIGGAICGKYGFSDIITPLLALNAQLVFHHEGKMSLEDFLLHKGKLQDVLLEVMIPASNAVGYFEAFKKTGLDFSVINVAVVQTPTELSIAVGARPGMAKVLRFKRESEDYSDLLKGIQQGNTALTEVFALKCCSNMTFGTNPRASKEYRHELAKVFIVEGLKEVLA